MPDRRPSTPASVWRRPIPGELADPAPTTATTPTPTLGDLGLGGHGLSRRSLVRALPAPFAAGWLVGAANPATAAEAPASGATTPLPAPTGPTTATPPAPAVPASPPAPPTAAPATAPSTTLPAPSTAAPGSAGSPAGSASANGLPVPTAAAPRLPGIVTLEARRGDDGLLLNFVVQVELTRSVEDALLKGVPLHFTAQALLMRERWYWTDRRINTATRNWRLAYQPLTRRFRVSQGGLAQSFDQLGEALAAVSRAAAWRVAEAAQLDDDARHYLEFAWRLDTSQLPRPMQIGIGGQADWSLGYGRTLRID
jgi:hypothetical protein